MHTAHTLHTWACQSNNLHKLAFQDAVSLYLLRLLEGNVLPEQLSQYATQHS